MCVYFETANAATQSVSNISIYFEKSVTIHSTSENMELGVFFFCKVAADWADTDESESENAEVEEMQLASPEQLFWDVLDS